MAVLRERKKVIQYNAERIPATVATKQRWSKKADNQVHTVTDKLSKPPIRSRKTRSGHLPSPSISPVPLKCNIQTIDSPEALAVVDELDDQKVELLPSGNPFRPPHILLKPPSLEEPHFGLIQESLRHNLFHLLIQTCLWNQTRGSQARPVLLRLLDRWPTPEQLASADLEELTAVLQPIGLQSIRAQRLIKYAKTWLDKPPDRSQRYRRLDYPHKGCGRDVKPTEVLSEADEREGWEIAHLPGAGAYAIDSYRIFIRDELRGVQPGAEPEWKRVVPLDKELRRYLVWRWDLEGWAWDPMTGKKQKKYD